MTFDKILAKLFFDKKFTSNQIIVIIALFHLIMYFILYKYIFMPMENSKSAVILVLTIFLLIFLYRIYILKKYLKELAEQV